jgi:hypothetical protein
MASDSPKIDLALEARVIRGEEVNRTEGNLFRAGVRFLGNSPATEVSLDKFLELLRRQGVE